ncbi:MAG: hypothetical protein U9P14_10785, partial [Gemmatimonadota bacterium]|nr:hypothetical protein [Gemmatimonadota bacterium]
LPSLGRPLSKEGYNVVVCPDFEEAEKLMGEKGFQLLVLDMRLGSSETRRFLDALHGRNETAVLLLTDSGQTERILDSLEQLKADYLDRSGLSERELLFKVSRLLKYNGQMGSVIETGN